MAKEKRTKDEVVGDTLIDLGKLIFGGGVLAVIFDSEMNKVLLVLGGLAICVALMANGIYLTTKK